MLSNLSNLNAQETVLGVRGTVTDARGQTLVGATVLTVPQHECIVADAQGRFEVAAEPFDTLRISYVGYQALNLLPEEFPADGKIVLQLQSLSEIQVTARKTGNYTSTLDPRNVESITSTELEKAPCCNLGESFETNAAVDVSYRDALTGAREIEVLGLRGLYAQLLLEKRPTLYGLAASQSLDLIPGTWLEGIQIGKGASSVQTGANALAGQVNAELIKPFESDPLFVNLFASGLGRVEANVHLAKTWNETSATGLLLHGSNTPKAFDRNGDGFYEQTGRNTYTAMLRQFYRKGDWRLQANAWGVRDRREGGQTPAAEVPSGGSRYVIEQQNDRLEVFAKAGYLGFVRPATSAGLIAGGTYHRLDNRYGATDHTADQRSAYVNLLFSSYVGSTDHRYTVGLSQSIDAYREDYAALDLDRMERAAGAYAEYTYDYTRGEEAGGKIYGASVIAGLRVDHHNLGGWFVLPRLNLKLNPNENVAVRLSAGRAYRSAQVLAENLRLLPAGQPLEFVEPIELTSGWNYGAALTQSLRTTSTNGDQHSGQLGLDLYATTFEQLTVVDQEQRYAGARVYNLDGPARTIAALGSIRFEVTHGFEVKAAYKWVDSRITYRGVGERLVPYTPRWRGLLTADYSFGGDRWRAHATGQLIGPQRLPELGSERIDSGEGPLFERESPVFAMLSTQVTYVANDLLEVYGGVENAFDYRQKQAIVSSGGDVDADSFFNASRVYAPLAGRMPYVGMRYTLGK